MDASGGSIEGKGQNQCLSWPKWNFGCIKTVFCSVQAMWTKWRPEGPGSFWKTWDLRTNLQVHSSIDWPTTSWTVTAFIQLKARGRVMDFAVTGIVPHLAELPGAYRLAAPLFWWRYYRQEAQNENNYKWSTGIILSIFNGTFSHRSHNFGKICTGVYIFSKIVAW